MNATYTLHTLVTLRPRRSVLLRGRHGIGKSEIVRQSCIERSKREGIPYEYIDIRLSQRESGDIIGMPRSVADYTVEITVYDKGIPSKQEKILTNTMVHDLPSWFPRDPESHGYIVFDELDRANREVQQSGFECVLDYRINQHDLPMGWHVIACVNADMDVYTVLEMDPALLDRFLVIDFEPTHPEWMAHAEKIGVIDPIMKYVGKHEDDLYSPEKMEPQKVYPSPRSWVKLSEDMAYQKSIGYDPMDDHEYLTLLAKGCVGSTTAVEFVKFIEQDYKVLLPEEILNRYNDDDRELVKKSVSTESAYYGNQLVAHIEKKDVTLTKKQAQNFWKFFKDLPQEVAGGVWKNFTRQCRSQAAFVFDAIPEVGNYIMDMLAEKKGDEEGEE